MASLVLAVAVIGHRPGADRLKCTQNAVPAKAFIHESIKINGLKLELEVTTDLSDLPSIRIGYGTLQHTLRYTIRAHPPSPLSPLAHQLSSMIFGDLWRDE
jgi:hypothetical protein